MKIEATCDTCKRHFLLSQIGPDSDAPGRCPFCGARFGRHYTTVLVEAVAAAEVEAQRFMHALDRLHSMETGFDIDLEKLISSMTEQIRQTHPAAVSP